MLRGALAVVEAAAHAQQGIIEITTKAQADTVLVGVFKGADQGVDGLGLGVGAVGIGAGQGGKIYVAGHTGLLGAAVVRVLRLAGYNNLLLIPHRELDLTNQQSVKDMFKNHRPDYVFLCAGKVGGIMANSTQRGDFIYINMLIQFNIIDSAYRYGVTNLYTCSDIYMTFIAIIIH